MAPSNNSDSQILTLILDEVRATRDDLTESMQRQARTEQSLEDHKANGQIHQIPPCPYADKADKKMWGALVASLLALLGVVGKVIYAKLFP